MFQENTRKHSVGEIIGVIVIFILAILIVCTFVVYGVFRDANTAPSIFGKRVYLMNGDGMEPRIKQGAAVFIDEGTMPAAPGNVILCDIDGRLAVVGFVETRDVTMPDGSVQTRYIVKYDNAPADQAWSVSKQDIIGRADTYDTTIGAIIRFASSKLGILLIVIIPCSLLVIYEILMLFISMKREAIPDEEELEDIDVLDITEVKDEKLPLDFGKMARTRADSKRNKPDSLEFGLNNGNKRSDRAASAEFDFDAVAGKPDDKKPQALEFSFEKKEEIRQEPESFGGSYSNNAGNDEPSKVLERQLDEVARALISDTAEQSAQQADQKTSNSDDQSVTSRIDELIKLLEEEKSKLSGK